MTKALLTAEELAVKLGVSKDTIRRWRRSGKLPSVKLGERMIRFRPSDVEAFLQTNQEPAEYDFEE
jgi:excisionase family DNA binding protein